MLCLGLYATTAWGNNIIAPKTSDFVGEVMYASDLLETRLYQAINASRNVLKSYLAEKCAEYGLDYDYMDKIVQCESSWDTDTLGDSKRALGLFQFHSPTFDRYCHGDRRNPFDQIDCATMMFSEGLDYHWTCATKILLN